MGVNKPAIFDIYLYRVGLLALEVRTIVCVPTVCIFVRGIVHNLLSSNVVIPKKMSAYFATL